MVQQIIDRSAAFAISKTLHYILFYSRVILFLTAEKALAVPMIFFSSIFDLRIRQQPEEGEFELFVKEVEEERHRKSIVSLFH